MLSVEMSFNADDGCDQIPKECGFGLLLYYWHLLHFLRSGFHHLPSSDHFLALSPQTGNTAATLRGYMAVEMLRKEYIFIYIVKSRRKLSSPCFLASGDG